VTEVSPRVEVPATRERGIYECKAVGGATRLRLRTFAVTERCAG
jgi:hypothetical protein